jgi:hypothetical protein
LDFNKGLKNAWDKSNGCALPGTRLVARRRLLPAPCCSHFMSETTLFLKKGLARAAYWRPVLLRGTLWIGLAMLTDLRHSMGELGKKLADHQAITVFDWNDAWVGVGIAALLTWRTFLDQTYSQHLVDKPEPPDHSKILG